MKLNINIIPTIIAVAVAALAGLLMGTLCSSTTNDSIIGITTGVSLAVTLLPMLAIKTDDARLNVNLRLVSTIFTIIVFVINLYVCLNTPSKLTIYFIIVGLVLLIYIGALYSLVRSSE